MNSERWDANSTPLVVVNWQCRGVPIEGERAKRAGARILSEPEDGPPAWLTQPSDRLYFKR